MRTVAWLALSTLVAGCASTAPAQKAPFSLGGGAAQQPFSASEYAAQHPQALECEAVARALQARSRDRAWAVLEACVATGNFWSLKALLTPSWLPELHRRADAANVLTKVVAARGGELAQDLPVLHAAKVPLFSLSDGLEEPSLYQGRLILLRAKVEELRREKGHLVAALSERALESERRTRQVGPTLVEAQEEHGRGPGANADHRLGWRSEQSQEVPYYENVSVDTGRLALADVPRDDPFLEPGQEFLVLARFDGLEPPESKADAPVARLTLIQYERPAGLVFY